jgi:L-lactate dehydrogenase (cytochrome)
LPPSKHLGPLADPENVKTVKQAALRPVDPSAAPPLEHNLTLDDIEASAQKLLSPKAWAYYRSAADHERAFDANASIWSAIRFRPRVLRGAPLRCLNGGSAHYSQA